MIVQRWRYLSSRNQILFLLLLTILLNGFFVAIVICPQYAKTRILSQQLYLLQTENKQTESYWQKQPEPTLWQMKLEQKKLCNANALPPQADLGEFLAELEKSAKMSEVILEQVQVKPPVQKENYAEVNLILGIGGTYYQILDFMNRIEESSRFTKVSQLAITRDSEEKKDMLKSRLNLHIYYFSP